MGSEVGGTAREECVTEFPTGVGGVFPTGRRGRVLVGLRGSGGDVSLGWSPW